MSSVKDGKTEAKLAQAERDLTAKRVAIDQQWKALLVTIREAQSLKAERDGLQEAIDEAQIRSHVDQMKAWIDLI